MNDLNRCVRKGSGRTGGFRRAVNPADRGDLTLETVGKLGRLGVFLATRREWQIIGEV